LFLKEQTRAGKQNAREESKTLCLNITDRYDIFSAVIIAAKQC